MLRELDQRTNAGLTVTLEWDSETDHVLVRCEDDRSPDHPGIRYLVDPAGARDAFLHPFTRADARAPAQSSPAGIADPPPEARGAIEATANPVSRWYQRRRQPGGHADFLSFTGWTTGLLMVLVLLSAR